MQFVKWDVHHNTALVIGDLILLQGDKGVPIGGHISTQLAELRALARELRYIFTSHWSDLQKRFRDTVRATPGLPPSVSQAVFQLSDPAEVYHPSGASRPMQELRGLPVLIVGLFFFEAWRSPAENNALKQPDHGHSKRSWRAEVHRRTAAGIYSDLHDRPSVVRGVLRADGCGGWWRTRDWQLGEISVAGLQVRLLQSSLWDAVPDERLGLILHNTYPGFL